MLLQSNPPVIQAWQVVALLGSIALVVLGAYGIPMTWLNPARLPFQ